MYALVAGGGKAGSNITRSLIRMGHEVTLIEQRPFRFAQLEAEFEHQVQQGDATELYVLERAGIGRPPDLVVALTGDDEDNLIISQIAKERYGVPKTIARVNDPRNQAHFDMIGISPSTSSSTCSSCARRTSRSSRCRSRRTRRRPGRPWSGCRSPKARG
jgi:trk system potassium uptake protein TrkA